MIDRPLYLQKLQPFIGTPLIKVITGIRRAGKSTVMQLLQTELQQRGLPAERIIYINFERFSAQELKDPKALYTYIQSHIRENIPYAVLLDEIQEVREWETVINALMVEFDIDLYITGSNSNLLSSELSTYLAGRFIEIPIYTLSFVEFLQFKKHYDTQSGNQDHKSLFMEYLRKGGFPVVHTGNYDEDTIYKIVQDIYASVILRDTVQRHKIRDVELLERVVKYAFDNIGNTFSGKNIADYFKSQQRKVDLNTVYNYLQALQSAFILHRADRYDVRGKEILKTQEKYYLGDISLLYAAMGFRASLIAGILENIIYLEMLRRGYRVYIGKLADKEIDFVAERQNEKCYIQVAYKLESAQTVAREFGALQAIADHHPKFVITMDELWQDNIDGIRHIHIANFLHPMNIS